jgi:cytochrome c oxidase subunit II
MRASKIKIMVALVVLTAVLSCFIGELVLAQGNEQVVKITAKKFVHSPKDFTLKKGVPVVLEFTSLDVMHGFNCPDLSIRSDILPGKVTTLRFTPQKVGTFPFHCDNFCGSGHETMTGTITVTE